MKSQAIPSGLPTQFCAAFGAGFFMACTVAPFDMVRMYAHVFRTVSAVLCIVYVHDQILCTYHGIS